MGEGDSEMTTRRVRWAVLVLWAAAGAVSAGMLRVTVTPVLTRVQVGGRVQFSATVHDEQNHLAAAGRVAWTVSGGGRISPAGVFQATTAGTHIVTASVPNTEVAGTATVVVCQEAAGPVAGVLVAPTQVALAAGQSTWFFAMAYDAQGRPVAAPLQWRVSQGGTLSPNGLYTAQAPGTHTLTVEVVGTRLSDSATVTVAPGIVVRVERVEVTPPVVTLRVGERRQLQATAYDARGHAVTVPLQWKCLGGGSMSAAGEFRAVRAGAWQVVAQAGPRGPQGKGTVVVWDPSAPRVTRVTVMPVLARAGVGKTVAFRAMAYDARGRRLNVPMTWAVTGQGEIDELTGKFRATHPGLVTVVAQVVGQPAKGSAKVTVGGPGAGVPARVEVKPRHTMLAPGATATFAVEAFGPRGRPAAVQPVWTATGGRITPGGVYTAGLKPGMYEVVARDKTSGLQAKAIVRIAPGGGRPPLGQASIAVDKWDLSDRLFEVRVRVDVTVRGPRLKEVKLFAIGRDGDDDRLDTEPCKDGARVHLSGKYTRGKARHIEIRLYDVAGKVVATERREARQGTRDQWPRIGDW